MSNPTGRGELTIEDAIGEVEETEELVLRCTLPTGPKVDHYPLDLHAVDGRIWLMYHERYKEVQTGNVVGVRNMAKRCNPDVEILHKRKSLFAEFESEGYDS